MNSLTIHTEDTAPNTSLDTLRSVKESIGFVPNIFAVVAESSSALKAFTSLNKNFGESSLTDIEQQIIQLIASTENACSYCVAGHTVFSDSLNISEDIINAIRSKQDISDYRLNALNIIVRSLIKNNGRVSKNEINTFFTAGYTSAEFLDVIVGVSIKTISNYVSNALEVPLDNVFEKYAWHDAGLVNKNAA